VLLLVLLLVLPESAEQLVVVLVDVELALCSQVVRGASFPEAKLLRASPRLVLLYTR